MATLVLASLAPLAACGPVPAHVWRPADPDFDYPENRVEHLAGREDFGLAFAGGGNRGAALAHGATRALSEAGLFNRAKYFSVTSGSVDFAIPLYFQTQDKLEDFLGGSSPPSDLSPETLVSPAAGMYVHRLSWPFFSKFPKEMNRSGSTLSLRGEGEPSGGLGALGRLPQDGPVLRALRALTGDELGECLQDLCECAASTLIPDGGALHEAYSIITALLGLRPYDILSPGSTYCHASQLESVRERLGHDQGVFVSQDVEHKLPYLVSQSAAFSFESGTNPTSDPLVTWPLENTLMYSGIPVVMKKGLLGRENWTAVGGMLVEPFASSSVALSAVPEGPEGDVQVQREVNPVNLGDLASWAGTATAYFADWQIRPNVVKYARLPCAVEFGKKVMPHAMLWSPYDVDEKGVPVTRDLATGDAGIYDDMGHLPLLRRGVKKMVILDSSAIHDDLARGMPNPEEMVYLKAAFGAKGGLVPPNPAGSPNPMMAENFLTVFDPSEFDALWQAILERYHAGEPAVVRGHYTVVDNPHFGIKGGRTVEIVWAILFPSRQWRSQLPPDTEKGLWPYFPNVMSGEPGSVFETSALSQYASWLFKEKVVAEVQAMLGDGPASEVLV